MHHTTRVIAALVVGLTGAGGCVAVDNDSHKIGGIVAIEAVSAPPAAGMAAVPSDGPSLTGADRNNWQRTPYMVPVSSIHHWPQYRFAGPLLNRTDRQRGISPSATDALELSRTNYEQVTEAVGAPVLAIAEAMLIVPRMFIDPPWVAVTSPGQWPYQRSRSSYDPPDAVDTVSP
jgi:hypothetical protein